MFFFRNINVGCQCNKNDTNRKKKYVQFAKKLMHTCIEISLNIPIHLAPKIVYFNIVKNDNNIFKFKKDFEIYESGGAHIIYYILQQWNIFFICRYLHTIKNIVMLDGKYFKIGKNMQK